MRGGDVKMRFALHEAIAPITITGSEKEVERPGGATALRGLPRVSLCRAVSTQSSTKQAKTSDGKCLKHVTNGNFTLKFWFDT
jgi:hypothetical protein